VTPTLASAPDIPVLPLPVVSRVKAALFARHAAWLAVNAGLLPSLSDAQVAAELAAIAQQP
jgi:hypothetical protein